MEKQFRTIGDADFLKYPKQIVLNGIFAQVQGARDIAVGQTVGQKVDHISLSLTQLREFEHSEGLRRRGWRGGEVQILEET